MQVAAFAETLNLLAAQVAHTASAVTLQAEATREPGWQTEQAPQDAAPAADHVAPLAQLLQLAAPAPE